MIAKARVSLSAVKQFAGKAEEIRDYSPQFANGTECVDNMQFHISSSASSLRGTAAAMESVRSRVAATMKQCETEIGWLTNKLNELRAKGANENEIQAVEAEIQSWRERLERAKSIDSNLSAHKETINQAIETLEKNENTCRQLKAELEALGNRNMRLGTRVCVSLEKVEKVVDEYLQIKIKRD